MSTKQAEMNQARALVHQAAAEAKAEIPCGSECVQGYCSCPDKVRLTRSGVYSNRLKPIIYSQAEEIARLKDRVAVLEDDEPHQPPQFCSIGHIKPCPCDDGDYKP